MKQSRAGDLLGRDLPRVDAEAIGAAPKDSSLTGGVIDENISALIGTILPKLDMVEVDALPEQTLHLNAAPLIVADCPDVLDTHAEFSAGYHRAGHLATRAQDL